jgi:hypothetical protein
MMTVGKFFYCISKKVISMAKKVMLQAKATKKSSTQDEKQRRCWLM